MRFLKLKVALSLFFIFTNSFGQNAVIDFTGTPQMYSGDGVYNPNYWANGGCPTYHQFGPNPLPVNGYNVRTTGRVLIVPTYTNTSTTYSMSIYAFGNMSTGQRENNAISVEYPFQANKSYLVEIEGVNDHNWDGNGIAGTRYNGVFWVKLDNDANLPTTSESPCVAKYTPVEKSVGRYSKLIADPDFSILARNHQVKFSLKEAKSALKITFDASPYVSGIKIDNIFRLGKIKITEIPYEEESGRYNSTYLNVPFPPRGTPGYDIPVISDNPTNQPGRIVTSISVNPNQWISNNNGTGYSFNITQLIQNLKGNNLVNISLNGGRPVRGEDGSFDLPCTYLDNNYSFTSINNEVVINVTSPVNIAPNSITNFNITYNNP